VSAALGVVKTVLAFAVILAPIEALAWWMTTWKGKGWERWLLLGPATFFWLAFVDLRWGLTARLARPPVRAVPRLRDAAEDGAA
jgi:hypothetical protein